MGGCRGVSGLDHRATTEVSPLLLLLLLLLLLTVARVDKEEVSKEMGPPPKHSAVCTAT